MAELEDRPSKIRKIDRLEGFLDESSEAQLSAELLEQSALADSQTPEVTPDGRDGTNNEERQAMSKSQLKKLRKKEQWEAGKDYRRIKRREKHKEKQARKAELRANGEIPASSEPANIEDGKKTRPKRVVQTPIALILDCDFDELMTEKELISLGAQLTRCYSENKHNPYRVHLAISSWGGRLKERFETVLTRNHESWRGVHFYEEDFMASAQLLDEIMKSPLGGKLAGALARQYCDEEVAGTSQESIPALTDEAKQAINVVEPNDKSTTFESAAPLEAATPASIEQPSLRDVAQSVSQDTADPVEESTAPKDDPLVPEAEPPSIVYLTSDSSDTLTYLEPNTTYIIGGIVDKNRYKGLCYKRARERGVRTAKLPIGEYMTMQSRSVLAVNHVVEIMLRWLETGDWGEAFLRVIPKRKEAKLKVKEDESEDDEGSVSVFEHSSENKPAEVPEVSEAPRPVSLQADHPSESKAELENAELPRLDIEDSAMDDNQHQNKHD